MNSSRFLTAMRRIVRCVLTGRIHPSRFLGALSLLLAVPHARATDFVLSEGWQMQSSARVSSGGAQISTPAFTAGGWYPITMPATIIAGLLQNNVFADPYFGKNLSAIDPAQFTPSWWYRKVFTLPPSENGKRVWLKFEGLNYRAAIWFNGTQLSNTTQTVGPFRAFEYDVTHLVNYTGSNVIAVQVTGPTNYQSDLTIFFIDWNPAPPDKNMGIVNDVVVRTSGPAKIRNPLVSTKLDLPSLAVAHLTVVAEVTNGTNAATTATVNGAIGSITFAQTVSLAARETKRVTFTPSAYPQLNVNNPALWWPWEYGNPTLHTLQLSVSVDGQVSDSLSTEFGMREVTSALNAAGHRVFSVNGKRILIRGAAWAPDMFQRRSAERQEAEVRYVRDLNLNLVRFEGKFEDENIFRLMDRHGLLVMVGWNCCDSFQRSGSWTAEQKAIAYDSLRNLMYRLRIHPSMMVWVNGSDEVSAPDVEQNYVNIEADLQWPAPTIAAAANRSTPQEGPTGVKMNGPYEYEPPSYWETDTNRRGGGAWGFATEISPGADVPVIESLRKFIPADQLWPINTYWTFHCNPGAFANLNVFTNAMNQRYGAATSAADYAAKAQLSTYESHRAMFEAYGRKKYTATGVIQWMLNNAWPGMFWHVYDYYLQPGGTYFGVKNALEPLHVQYSYVDRTVTVVNSTLQSHAGLTARAQVFNLDGSLKHNQSGGLTSGPDSSVDAFTLPSIAGLSPTYFLRLTLTNSSGAVVSTNTYWLSTKADVVDWASYGDPWFYTRQSAYADLKALGTLPAAAVTYQHASQAIGDEREHSVTLTNTGSTLAFFLRLKLNRASDGEEILPVIWEDNYVTLIPGETRTVKARYASVDLEGSTPVLQIVPYRSNVTVTPGDGTLPVANPAFSPAPGSFAGPQTVTITTATAGAAIRYTTDGSTPAATTGTPYGGPVSIASTTTLRAIAYKAGMTDSAVVSGTYTIGAGTDEKLPVPGSAVTASANDGNVPANAVDGNLATRWSASGDPQWIQFALGGPRRVAFVKIAFYNGTARSSRFDLQTSTNGSTFVNARTGVVSSGTSTALETFDLPDVEGATHVRIVGHGNTVNLWNSYTEVEIWGGTSGTPTQVAAPTFNPPGGSYTAPVSVTIATTTAGSTLRYTTDGSAPTSSTGTVYTGPIAVSSTTTIRAIGYAPGMSDSPVSNANYAINPGGTPQKLAIVPPVTASGHDGNLPGNTIDGNLATRWSASGDPQWIQFNLGAARTVSFVKIAFYNGNVRTTAFEVLVSADGTTWNTVVPRRNSSGTTTALETFDFTDVPGQHVRIVGHGNSVNLWNSLTEVEIWGLASAP